MASGIKFVLGVPFIKLIGYSRYRLLHFIDGMTVGRWCLQRRRRAYGVNFDRGNQ